MTTLKKTTILIISLLAIGAIERTARAEEVVERKLGVGYKVGNGIGFAGGDLIYRAFPHVGFDLQINYFGAKDSLANGSPVTYSGVGLAPAVHAQLRPIGHTPYLAVGAIYARLAAHHEGDTITGTGAGFFVNAGYEWRFASGVGVLLGAGVGDLVSMHFAGPSASADMNPNDVYFNIEGGVRYFF
jgi:hypothetical protein